MKQKVALLLLITMLSFETFALNDSTVYWKRYASFSLLSVGTVHDFNIQKKFDNYINFGPLEFNLGIRKKGNPLLLSFSLDGVYDSFFFSFGSSEPLNIISGRFGSHLLKKQKFEIFCTSGVGMVVNDLNSIYYISSSMLKIAYYPIKNLGISTGVGYFLGNDVSVLVNNVSIIFRNGL